MPALAELGELYSEKILAIAGNPPAAPRLAAPDASVKRVSRLCGSTVEVDIVVDGGVVAQYGHTVRACALGQTSAAIVARHIAGTSTAEFRQLATTMRCMLTAGGPPPSGRWDDLRYLEPVREYPHRHASTLLVFDAVVEALDTIEAG